MKKKYQKLNPSNARIEIDYNKNKVKMDYVQHDSAFKVCFKAFVKFTLFFNMIILSLGCIIFIFLTNNKNKVEFIWTEADFIMISILLTIFIWMILFNTLLALLFSKNNKLLKLMPQINYILDFRKPIIAEFNPKDVVDNKVEIPLFSNVGLDYEAEKEFSKYLTRVQIKEHDFNMLTRTKKKKPNIYLWKATFYFKQKPKTGKLEVRFK